MNPLPLPSGLPDVPGLTGWVISALLAGLCWQTLRREKEHSDRILKLEADLEVRDKAYDALQEDLVQEVKRSARSIGLARYALALKSGRPAVPPTDQDWQETTAVIREIKLRDAAEIDRLCREFAEDTPPRPKLPSRAGKS